MTPIERERIFTAAREAILAALPDSWAIYVHGSFARGEEWPESDLDLAVRLPPGRDIPDLLHERSFCPLIWAHAWRKWLGS